MKLKMLAVPERKKMLPSVMTLGNSIRESCLVIISNVTENMDDRDLLKTYKGQQVVENSFRLLKSPSVASVIYLKNPKRIQALSMLLTFSL